jgi:hypothetical protein
MNFAAEDNLDDDVDEQPQEEDMENDEGEDLGAFEHAAIPNKLSKLRACIPCLLVKVLFCHAN